MTAGTAPFDLPETVNLPGGRRWGGNRARVYWLLRLTAERRHAHAMDTTAPTVGPAGWVPIHTLRAPWAGGAQGDRRVRDLHELGVAYEVRRWSDLGGPQDSAATLYRLTSDALAPLNGGTGTSPPSHFHQPSAPRGERRHPAAPRNELARLRFWVSPGAQPAGAAASLRADHTGGHPLAPPADLVRDLAAGELDAKAADECYRQHLLEVYHRTRFASVSGLLHLVVWTSAEPLPGGWSPLPMLVRALTALGAQHQGTWGESAA